MNQNTSSSARPEHGPVPRAYTVKDAAQAYAISRSRIYVLLKDGKLRDRKVGGRRVILASDLDALVGAEG
ncbi:helix-turn-helix domain-containing protein [Xanthobacter aminoxidans]|uniref:helix-turn-helix domain-containing protein n=1 Tax=Xanthobacter aminoxidans TaxID=186280 RepID=UPI003729D8B2